MNEEPLMLCEHTTLAEDAIIETQPLTNPLFPILVRLNKKLLKADEELDAKNLEIAKLKNILK